MYPKSTTCGVFSTDVSRHRRLLSWPAPWSRSGTEFHRRFTQSTENTCGVRSISESLIWWLMAAYPAIKHVMASVTITGWPRLRSWWMLTHKVSWSLVIWWSWNYCYDTELYTGSGTPPLADKFYFQHALTNVCEQFKWDHLQKWSYE